MQRTPSARAGAFRLPPPGLVAADGPSLGVTTRGFGEGQAIVMEGPSFAHARLGAVGVLGPLHTSVQKRQRQGGGTAVVRSRAAMSNAGDERQTGRRIRKERAGVHTRAPAPQQWCMAAGAMSGEPGRRSGKARTAQKDARPSAAAVLKALHNALTAPPCSSHCLLAARPAQHAHAADAFGLSWCVSPPAPRPRRR